jgi:tripartite-type tricarboxylate transporter receptor subunit TctC
MQAIRVALAAFALTFGFAGASRAQDFPSRPIQVVVPYAPGGASDTMARTVAPKLGELLGQTVVIENKPGGNTNIGAQSVAHAAANGYTLLFSNDATYTFNPALFRSLPYDMKRDFAPVATVAYMNLAMIIPASVPVDNFAEFVSWARQNSGKISYGSYGVGSQAHIMGETFKKITGVDAVHVPYKGAAPATASVVASETAFTFPTLATAHGFIQSGKVKVIAISGDTRSTLAPQAPTFAEVGMQDMNIGAWYAFFAPKATPAAAIGRVNQAVRTMLADKSFVEEQLVKKGMLPMSLTPEQVADLLARETERIARIVKQSGATVE